MMVQILFENRVNVKVEDNSGNWALRAATSRSNWAIA
jgi:hypothetical protein